MDRGARPAPSGGRRRPRDGPVVGWGSLNAFNPRPPTTTWWISRSTSSGPGAGAGWGRRCCSTCWGWRELGYHKIVLATFPVNDAGLALYRRMGFSPVGVYHEQGQLDGRWVDVLIMEQLL